jgi:hypothetical protein
VKSFHNKTLPFTPNTAVLYHSFFQRVLVNNICIHQLINTIKKMNSMKLTVVAIALSSLGFLAFGSLESLEQKK